MQMNRESLQNKTGWQAAGVKLPAYNVAAMAKATGGAPIWVHFGAGNIFRGFIAVLQQRLLDEGLAEKGIIAAETFDFDIVDKIYTPYDNLTMNVTLNADASMDCEVIASVAEAVKADSADAAQMARLAEIFTQPGLQMASFTITEKGYALRGANGALLPAAKQDMETGPAAPCSAMGITAAMLHRRWLAGGHPLAVVSMDNCAHNGEKLQAAVLEMAEAWQKAGFADAGFISYLEDESKITFPWTMIDKITPRPAAVVEDALTKKGIGAMAPIVTGRGTFIAPFVNAERPQYLVVEDAFPNGRPPLEKAGVYMASRATVNKTERMKVTTCLNPLHTAMSVYGCLLGYTLISEEMKDADIVALIKRLGYTEGLPVVTDPGIINPRAFIDEVVDERLPNLFMPDAPQRIATDTSQKVSIRFGETIKSYVADGLDLGTLTAVPLALAGWLRYLLGTDDEGNPMEVSADPMKEELQAALSTVRWNDAASCTGQLKPILANANIFGSDLTKTALAGHIEEYFRQMLAGPGAVRATLHGALAEQ